jgi:hypothetical protein
MMTTIKYQTISSNLKMDWNEPQDTCVQKSNNWIVLQESVR